VRPKKIAFAIVTALIVFLAGGSPEAQQPTKVPRVGFLNPVDRSVPTSRHSDKDLPTSVMSKAATSQSSHDSRKGSTSDFPIFLPN